MPVDDSNHWIDTNGMIATGTNVREHIKRPDFGKSIMGSDKEDFMTTLDM